jgi:pyruvate carboxylase
VTSIPTRVHAQSKGDSVSEEERLCSIEAIKMESSVTSSIDGRIKKIHIAPGDQIKTRDLILSLN